MSRKAFDKIAEGLENAVAIARGDADSASYRVHNLADVDVKAIRERQHLTQAEFAARYGISLGRLRDWEQGRSPIDSPARLLLTVIDREPEAVERALAAPATLESAK
jgi:putative transcriptional regulator